MFYSDLPSTINLIRFQPNLMNVAGIIIVKSCSPILNG
ncbi:hypothetical protein J2S67_000143 [Pseudoglutamicibacter albus]|uniref:Uncharacterized protein n=1 Tax=Pseudoglutamicibacter albus TaxID=98671 RepID=A0ABU1YYN1_9MICC|nr:hypothetical protein [Pseudoglutamicibacter albus]